MAMVILNTRKYEAGKSKDALKILPRTQCIKKKKNLVEMPK